ncbi:MAG: hypothetical protein ACRDCF_00035, partial [Mycoplasmoidaceae bacterium]
PGVDITVVLKDAYSTDNPIKFTSGTLGQVGKKNLAVTIGPDAAAAATTYLETIVTGSYDEQETAYTNLNGDATEEFINSIKNEIIFNGGNVSWDDAVANVTLTTGTFPIEGSIDEIPGVEITIVLKDAYSTDNPIKFTSGTLGQVGKKNLVVTGEIEAAAAATTYLETIVTGSYDEQKTAYTNLNGNATEEFINSIKNEIIFNGGNVSWDDAVANVTLTTGTFPSEGSIDEIPGVEITIVLKDAYSTDNPIKFTSGTLGQVGTKNLVVTGEIEAEAAATTYLETIVTGSYDEQKTAYKNLDGNATEEFINSIKNEIIFNGGSVSWDDAVANVTLTTGTFPKNAGDPIPKVKIEIKLNNGYIVTSGNLLFECDLGNLNVTGVDINATKKLQETTSDYFKNLLSNNNYNDQKKIYNEWETKNPDGLIDLLKIAVIFNSGALKWDNIVENVNVLTPFPFAGKPGSNISYITIKINFKPGYNDTNGGFITFNSLPLGPSSRV